MKWFRERCLLYFARHSSVRVPTRPLARRYLRYTAFAPCAMLRQQQAAAHTVVLRAFGLREGRETGYRGETPWYTYDTQKKIITGQKLSGPPGNPDYRGTIISQSHSNKMSRSATVFSRCIRTAHQRLVDMHEMNT